MGKDGRGRERKGREVVRMRLEREVGGKCNILGRGNRA